MSCRFASQTNYRNEKEKNQIPDPKKKKTKLSPLAGLLLSLLSAITIGVLLFLIIISRFNPHFMLIALPVIAVLVVVLILLKA